MSSLIPIDSNPHILSAPTSQGPTPAVQIAQQIIPLTAAIPFNPSSQNERKKPMLAVDLTASTYNSPPSSPGTPYYLGSNNVASYHSFQAFRHPQSLAAANLPNPSSQNASSKPILSVDVTEPSDKSPPSSPGTPYAYISPGELSAYYARRLK